MAQELEELALLGADERLGHGIDEGDDQMLERIEAGRITEARLNALVPIYEELLALLSERVGWVQVDEPGLVLGCEGLHIDVVGAPEQLDALLPSGIGLIQVDEPAIREGLPLRRMVDAARRARRRLGVGTS